MDEYAGASAGAKGHDLLRFPCRIRTERIGGRPEGLLDCACACETLFSVKFGKGLRGGQASSNVLQGFYCGEGWPIQETPGPENARTHAVREFCPLVGVAAWGEGNQHIGKA